MLMRLEHLQQRARKVSSAEAATLDGWNQADLKLLPLPSWSSFTLLELAVGTRKASWPTSFRQVSMIMLAKDDSGQVLARRPITVISRLLSTWSGLRYREAEDWHRSWCPPNEISINKNLRCASNKYLMRHSLYVK